MVQIPEILTEYKTAHVISSFKILADSNKISVGGGVP